MDQNVVTRLRQVGKKLEHHAGIERKILLEKRFA
jgi:hypothetical protein